MIQIEQADGANAAAGERFHHPGANPADTNYRDMGCAEMRQPAVAIQSRYTTEPTFVIHCATS
jgi:hypothetical protein